MDIFKMAQNIATKIINSIEDDNNYNKNVNESNVNNNESNNKVDNKNTIKNFSKNVIVDKDNDITQNISDIIKEGKNIFNSAFKTNTTITNSPKIELAVRKYVDEEIDNKNTSIDEYVLKYWGNSLQDKINSMSNLEKAYLYYYIAYKLEKISEIIGSRIEIAELALAYYDKALELSPDNVDIAYELFRFCFKRDNYFDKKRSVDICELCIKLSNNQDIKKEFCNIYYFMGKHYYLGVHNDNEKALEYYTKALNYCYGPKEDYLHIYRDMAYIYKSTGDNKKGVETINYIESVKKDFYDIKELRRARSQMECNLSEGRTKEQEEYKRLVIDAKIYFKNSFDKHTLEEIVNAYKIYLHAEELMSKGKRLESIEEYKKVKNLLPEEASMLDSLISLNYEEYVRTNDSDKEFSEFREALEERIECAIRTGNNTALCSAYNELAIDYERTKNYDKAEEYFIKAINLSSRPFKYYENIAWCLVSLKRFDEAIQYYKKLKEEVPEWAKQSNADYQISRIEDIKNGKTDIKGKNLQLANEHFNKGNQAFNDGLYEQAIVEYNAALGIKDDDCEIYARKILSEDIYEYHYTEESQLVFDALKTCPIKDDFRYLPFIFTVYGDYISYQAWGDMDLPAEYYELAVYLLNMIPVKERFAAPYYKLGRQKEMKKQYKEALDLFKKAKEIDSTYNTYSDILRIEKELEDNGESNFNEAKKHLRLMKRFQEANNLKNAISEGKEILKYAPDNVNVFYEICKIAEQLSSYNDLKWLAKEGLRLALADYNNKKLYHKFIFMLGKCCKAENKKEQAKYYFNIITDYEERCDYELKEAAQNELYLIYQEERNNSNL